MEIVLRGLAGVAGFSIPLVIMLQWMFRDGWLVNVRRVLLVDILLGIGIGGISCAMGIWP